MSEFIENFLYSSHVFGSISQDDPIILDSQRSPADEKDVHKLKEYLDVLFFFQRSYCVDEDERDTSKKMKFFYAFIGKYISILVGALIRRATYDDHLYVLFGVIFPAVL